MQITPSGGSVLGANQHDMSSMLKSVHAQESLTSTQTKDGTSYRVSIR
jgi:hypothetical protein